jgi:hypothetical protein
LGYLMTFFYFIGYVMLNGRMIVNCELEKMWEWSLPSLTKCQLTWSLIPRQSLYSNSCVMCWVFCNLYFVSVFHLVTNRCSSVMFRDQRMHLTYQTTLKRVLK